MLTQDSNSAPGFSYDLRLYDSLSFPTLHVHRSAELILPIEGCAKVTVGNREYTLGTGYALLVLPFVPHAFEAEDAKLVVCVFSRECARDFYEYLGNRRCGDPIFQPSGAAVKYLVERLGFYRTTDRGSVYQKNDLPPLAVTSVLSAVLGSFLVQVKFDSEPGISEKLLDYISLHSAEDLTLRSLAAAFGYEPHYLSRILGRCTGMNFRALVNSCRVEAAKELMTCGTPITEAALSTGFGSLRTFDRVFQEFVGMSPGKWVRQVR